MEMIQLVEEDKRNRAVGIEEIKQMHQNQFSVCSTPALYHPYNLDVNDQGWGCAWRAIQTLLSNKNILIPFQLLYNTFSKKGLLLSIAKQNIKITQDDIKQLQQRKWAPEQTQKHWAEPFIASLICWHHKIPNHLLLLNGYPQAYAPKSVFERVVNCKEFFEIIKSTIINGTIMIDDGIYALSIVGFKQDSNETLELLFADPHIKSNRQYGDVGLYRKTFDLQGRSINEDKRRAWQVNESLYNVFQALEFENKNWMICFIDS